MTRMSEHRGRTRVSIRVALLAGLLGLTLGGCSSETVGGDTCGDGVLDAWEVCDGAELGGETCATRGFEGGTLGCRETCQFDTSQCYGLVDDCGDGVCQLGEDEESCPDDCSSVTLPALPEAWGVPGRWWILVHPNYPSNHGSGVHLVDTPAGTVVLTLPLPEEAGSPHGLTAGPEGVMLSDSVAEQVFRIGLDGVAEAAGLSGMTEGLARTATGLWMAPNPFPELDWFATHHLPDGTETLRIALDAGVVNDLAYDGRYLYYVENGATDPIVRVDPHTGAHDVIVEHTTEATYTLAYDGEALVVDDRQGAFNRYDVVSGDLVDVVPHDVTGWITAIAPAWGTGNEPPR